MKRRSLLKILCAVAIAAGLSLVAASAREKSKFLMATGQLCQETYLDPGTVKCIGGTFDPNTGWCSPGTKSTLIRDAVGSWSCSGVAGSAATMFQGPLIGVTNCNLDENLQGECWGTFEWDIEAGGKWKGIWSGKFDLMNYIAVYSGVGHGDGGNIDGLNMKWDAMSPGGSPCFIFLAQVLNR